MNNGKLTKIIYPIMLGYTVLAALVPSAFAFGLTNPISGVSDLRDLINNLLNWMMGFIGIIAVVYLMMAGFKYVTAGGDSKKAQEAKEGITQAIIGIAIAVIGYLLVSLVFEVLQVNKDITKNALGQ
ncbi:hypothetical protein AUK40_03190 [Candidatus Wirthbacteria bacterium CG2_30_54_11]|uniref:Uncharacterized protein n=1 Tax=Candidatus Wirthbacteria bacterium CG2_30_54_11 TaxID=1817892 RepID=A0A1J5ISW2_9BACT|nr:MAG: hypothetical protein AUK40_03190 [Candidatus Wirthbacteria bacterium CG2_30_54_11]